MVSGTSEPAVYLIKVATVTGSCADVDINKTRTSTAEIKGLKNIKSRQRAVFNLHKA